MADFSSSEKRNLSFKHVLGIVGTNNLDGGNGRAWYEETVAGTHPVYLPGARSEFIPDAANLTTARTNAQNYSSVEDRSQGESITLVANGSDWDITTSTIVPVVGYQITDVHPNPTYIKSITSVVDNGGGSYTITLNNNSGVSAGSAVLHSRIYLTLDPTSNNKTWFFKEVYGNFFSSTINDFLDPFEFGRGYTLNVFQADGTQIQVTQGAWFVNWAEGLLVFADGYTAIDEGYNTPLYIEGFRYNGTLGVSGVSINVLKDNVPVLSGVTDFNFDSGFSLSGTGNQINISFTGVADSGSADVLPGADLYDTLFWNGSEWEPTGYLQISGSNVFATDRLEVLGSIVIPSGVAPMETASPGLVGEVKFDQNFIYLHTGYGGWRRVEIAVFGSSPGSPPILPPPTFTLGLGGVYQTSFSGNVDLDQSYNSFPLETSAVIDRGNVFTLTSSGVQVVTQGLYKVTWNLEGERLNGSTQRRILTTNATLDGIDVPDSTTHGYVRDTTNNTTNSQNSIVVETTQANQTISIKSNQTGSGDPGSSGTFKSKGGHLLIEYIGAT